jgi:hypothetical protein
VTTSADPDPKKDNTHPPAPGRKERKTKGETKENALSITTYRPRPPSARIPGMSGNTPRLPPNEVGIDSAATENGGTND